LRNDRGQVAPVPGTGRRSLLPHDPATRTQREAYRTVNNAMESWRQLVGGCCAGRCVMFARGAPMLDLLSRLVADLTLLDEDLDVVLSELRSAGARPRAGMARTAEMRDLLIEELCAHLRELRDRRREIKRQFEALSRARSGDSCGA